jgi:hypothetical protein
LNWRNRLNPHVRHLFHAHNSTSSSFCWCSSPNYQMPSCSSCFPEWSIHNNKKKENWRMLS